MSAKKKSGCARYLGTALVVVATVVPVYLVISKFVGDPIGDFIAGLRTFGSYGEVSSLCVNLPSEAQKGDLTSITGTPKVLMLVRGRKILHEWQDRLPQKWRAQPGDAVDLVVCIDNERTCEEVVERVCDYEPYGRVTLYRQDYRVIVLDSTTGQVVGSVTLEGHPDHCPYIIEHSMKLHGDRPSYAEFQNWLEDHVIFQLTE